MIISKFGCRIKLLN